MLETPVLFLVFNRPDVTRQVFERIREVQPKRLFVAADGPRQSHMEDEKKCQEVREIVTRIDWDCELITSFRDENLGCKNGVSSAIDWFFGQVEAGLILEDDVFPDISFFYFCEQLLEYYKNDQRIMMISGLNVCEKWKEDTQDYHFSFFGGIWGWATWRRAWKDYDVDVKKWADPDVERLLLEFFPLEVREARKNLYEALYLGRIDTWDLQWTFAKILSSGLTIIPSYNLVKNIGCTGDGTHVKTDHAWANLKVNSLGSTVKTNSIVISDVKYDLIHLGINENSGKVKTFIRKLKKLYLQF